MQTPAVHIRRFLRGDAGGATTLGVFALALTTIVVGFAMDASNLYRQQSLMRHTADAAAHAGVVALARGGTAAEAEAAAAAMIEKNLPAAGFGRLVADPATDLRALVFDPATGRLAVPDDEAPANAMLVQLQRGAAAGNPVPTYVLRLIGFDGWTTGASSVAAIVPSQRCPNAAGLVARGKLALAGGVRAGEGVCLHSQDSIALPAGSAMDMDARLSLPMPDRCSEACAAAVVGMNLVMPQAADHLLRLAEGFARPDLELPEEAIFFAARRFDADLEPLAEVRVDTRHLGRGDTIPLTSFLFGVLRSYPAGLVYTVTCGPPEAGNKPEPLVLGQDPQAPPLRDLVLITDCPLRLGPYARLEGTLVFLLGDTETADLAAERGARIGAAPGACTAGARSLVMTPGNLVLPAGLVGAGLGVVTGGGIVLVADEGAPEHRGFAAHAGAGLRVEGAQRFAHCPQDSDPLLPPLRVITHVMPPLDGWVTPLPRALPDRELPGSAVKALPMAGSGKGRRATAENG